MVGGGECSQEYVTEFGQKMRGVCSAFGTFEKSANHFPALFAHFGYALPIRPLHAEVVQVDTDCDGQRVQRVEWLIEGEMSVWSH